MLQHLIPSHSVRRRSLVLGAGAAALVPAARAQGHYPSQPIRMIVPFAPGGSGSYLAREVSERLSRRLGASIVVDNRPGASGNIGAATVATAKGDGYTLLATASSIALTPALFANPGFVLERDLVPVAPLGTIPFGLHVNAQMPARNLQELVAWMKAQPTPVAYASSGSGNLTFLAMHLLLQRLGLQATHVPYSGAAPALLDVLRGEPPMMMNDLFVGREHVKSGKLRLIAVTSAQRSAMSPEIPTLAESGVPGFDASGWIGLFAPASTPSDIVERLNAEMRAIVSEPDFRDKLLPQGMEPPPLQTLDAYRAFVAQETKRWGGIIRATGVKVT